jgi:nickel-dependent lactate racemase
MMTNIIKLPQMAWDDPRDVDFPLPDEWDVEICNIAGYNRPALTDEQIKASITSLISTAPIREQAKNKKQVVILFDDMTRITRASKIVPFILEELALAGISDDQIRFMAATGTHGPINRWDFAKKLGADIVARYPVYNHNPYENCTYVGTTSYDTKVYINAEVMHCDFKIGIGSVTPHGFAVFSGGGKIVLPGVSSIDTVEANHKIPLSAENRRDYTTNPRRRDMEEVAKLAGINVLVQCIVNMRGDSVNIFAGDKTATAEAAVEVAKTHYLAPKATDKDIVIANAYVKASEAGGVTRGAAVSLKESGGDIVVVANSPSGHVNHYLMGSWGRTIGGRMNMKHPIDPKINHYLYYSQYPEMSSVINIEPPGKTQLISDWGNVVQTLKEYHGDSASVAVYPSADIQYLG